MTTNLQLVFYSLIALLILYLIIKLLKLPFKLLINGLSGVIALLIINYFGSMYGLVLPINFFTALLTGFLGIPGVLLIIFYMILI